LANREDFDLDSWLTRVQSAKWFMLAATLAGLSLYSALQGDPDLARPAAIGAFLALIIHFLWRPLMWLLFDRHHSEG
jgi:hypothetical protein